MVTVQQFFIQRQFDERLKARRPMNASRLKVPLTVQRQHRKQADSPSCSCWHDFKNLRNRIRQLRRILATVLLSGTVLVIAVIAPNPAYAAPDQTDQTVDRFAEYIADAANRFAIPEHWIRAVMQVESASHVHAVSSKGAMGLMQIMPETWAELRDRYDLGNDPFRPSDNILAGTAYLRLMQDRFGSPGFLAAYNAGPNRFEQFLFDGRPLPQETIDYVARLAPLIGSEPFELDLPTHSSTKNWRDSPLFVPSLGTGRSTDASVSAARRQTPVGALNGMFVPSHDAGNAR